MTARTGHDGAKPQTVLESLIRRWRQRPDWSESERRVVVADLMPEGFERRRFLARFVTLSVLSTVLASFGLISNSIATLIAGMLLDPLMTPVLGIAASMVFGQPTRVLRALATVGGGTLVAIATGWLVAAISPGFASTDDLTSELLLRTSPSLLDLGVAVAAGVSAGYVLTHREANSVIPGVAIAVALVPPLAAVGVLLNIGATDEARGAFLLYATNLGAIILAATAMLLVSGFVPGDIRGGSRRSVRAGFAFTAALLLVIAVPLAAQTFEVIEERNFQRAVNDAIQEWDPTASSIEVTTSLDNDRGSVIVVVSTLDPEPAERLAVLIRDGTGRPVDVEVEYLLKTDDTAVAD